MKTNGRFDCKEVREWPATIGMNKKGGMNDNEFDKYIDNSFVPLFPDLKDVPGIMCSSRWIAAQDGMGQRCF
jgi:hypothetical protein